MNRQQSGPGIRSFEKANVDRMRDEMWSQFPTADERYILRDVRAGCPDCDLAPAYIEENRTFGVWDKLKATWAMLPNAVLLWGLTADDALDGLNEMRGRYRAEDLRND